MRCSKNAWVETNALASESWYQMVVTHERFHFGFVESGQSGQPGRSRPGLALTALTECGVFVIFGMASTEDSELAYWCWDPDVWVSEACGTNGCIAHIYTGSNVQVYVNGTIRENWTKG